MNDTQRGIITLIRSAINGEALPLPEGFSMETAYPLLVRHHIVPVAYTGAVKCGVDKTLPQMKQLLRMYRQCLMKVEGQMQEVERIFAAFDENQIDYMPLKGCKNNALYPKPEMRLMGDADILIRMEQYPKIQSVMQDLGFTEGYESDHELTWDSQALHVELHKRLIPTDRKDYYTFFENCWALAKRVNGGRHTLSAEEEFVFLFGHFIKHYRGSGIGLRHVIDLWVFRRANPQMDEAYIRQRLAEMHFTEFYDNILRLLDVWFGDAPEDAKTDFITEYIFRSGSWGTGAAGMLSRAAKNLDATGSGKQAKKKTVLANIFPGVSHMASRYPIVAKVPVLLPLFWPVRWVTALLFRRKNVKLHYRFVRGATPEKIENFQQALQYVGLDCGK